MLMRTEHAEHRSATALFRPRRTCGCAARSRRPGHGSIGLSARDVRARHALRREFHDDQAFALVPRSGTRPPSLAPRHRSPTPADIRAPPPARCSVKFFALVTDSAEIGRSVAYIDPPSSRKISFARLFARRVTPGGASACERDDCGVK